MSQSTSGKHPGPRHAATRLALALAALAAFGMPASALAQPKGSLTIALPGLVQQFDPTALTGMVPYIAHDFIFDGLINLGPNGKYPALAESWDTAADGLQITFKLRQNVKFHNGDPFTAEDVKFTFDRILAPDSGHLYRRGFATAMERVEVVDPHTVRFVLKQPWPPFFTTNRYALSPIVPKKHYESVGARAFQEHPIGTGPFRFAENKSGEWTKFEANEGYWGIVPKVKTVTEILVKEPFTRYAMLERGEADIVGGLSGPLLDKAKANPKAKLYMSRYSGSSFILFNTDTFPEAADRRVRMAIGHAIDRSRIATNMLGNTCELATSVFTPATFGFLEGLPQLSYDPAKAKALLAEAGIKPGHKVTFVVQTESFIALPNAPVVLEAIAGNLEAVGLGVVRQTVDNVTWLSMLRSRNASGIFNLPLALPDDGGETINSYFSAGGGLSKKGNDPSEYDEIFKTQAVALDAKARAGILQRFAKLEAENHNAIPLFWCDTPFVVNAERVKAWNPALGSGYHFNVKELEMAK
ncbi:MAG: ABC transporter substrate-binding protein [Reyranellaceae bacterium]